METFLRVLRALLDGVGHDTLSTADFFSLLGRITSSDLVDFARQFVHGTGIPHVDYRLDFEPLGESGWRVFGEATLRPAARYEYAVARHPDGALDVARTRLEEVAVEDLELVVPLQVAVYDPTVRGGATDPQRTGNQVVQFTAVLSGVTTSLELTVEHEPKQVWLDAGSQVLGVFRNRRHTPKEALLEQGVDLARAGRHEAGEDMLRRALAAAVEVGPGLGAGPSPDELAERGHTLDADIHFALADLYLDQRRPESAATELERGIAALGEVDRTALRKRRHRPDEAVVLEARLALQRGDPEEAHRLLAKPVLRQRTIRSRPALLVLAIAAYLTGETDDLAEALDRARRRDCDVSALERATRAAGPDAVDSRSEGR